MVIFHSYVSLPEGNGHNCPLMPLSQSRASTDLHHPLTNKLRGLASVDLWQLSIQPETLDGSEMPHDPFAKITGIGKAMAKYAKN